MLTAVDFEKLGFWEDSTPEENITIYGNDLKIIRLDDYTIVIKGIFNKLIMGKEI